MANDSFNFIKPVETLNNIAGMSPTKRRAQRKQQQKKKEKDKKPGQQEDEFRKEQDIDDQTAKMKNTLNDDGTGIDFCA